MTEYNRLAIRINGNEHDLLELGVKDPYEESRKDESYKNVFSYDKGNYVILRKYGMSEVGASEAISCHTAEEMDAIIGFVINYGRYFE